MAPEQFLFSVEFLWKVIFILQCGTLSLLIYIIYVDPDTYSEYGSKLDPDPHHSFSCILWHKYRGL